MIQRDHNTIDQSVWGQLRYNRDLSFLTLEQAKHVVEFAAQLIRWREQEIHERLGCATASAGLMTRDQAREQLEADAIPLLQPRQPVAWADKPATVAVDNALHADHEGKAVHALVDDVPAPEPTGDCPRDQRCSQYPNCTCGPF